LLPARREKARRWAGLLYSREGNNYFCCSLGLSAGFGGLPWVCCCGVAGVDDGVAGFCGSDAEIGTVVMEYPFMKRTK
jgi:hypothetical protein